MSNESMAKQQMLHNEKLIRGHGETMKRITALHAKLTRMLEKRQDELAEAPLQRIEDAILLLLRDRARLFGSGATAASVSRTEIRDLFARKRSAQQIEAVLDRLEKAGTLVRERVLTRGRPQERWAFQCPLDRTHTRTKPRSRPKGKGKGNGKRRAKPPKEPT